MEIARPYSTDSHRGSPIHSEYNSTLQKIERTSERWGHAAAILLAALFTVLSSALMILKHDTFNTRTYDLARFDQAIWNTLHGRFLFSTILNQSILGNHFSPYMAALSPLLLLWDDVRVLFIAQAVGVAVGGLLLYRIVYERRPALAPWFLLAFYLNPAVHHITTFELRRISLAVPWLALALYALSARRRGLLALGLAVALLCKENVGFVVFTFGIYLLLFERDLKWGVTLALLGAAWVIVISVWVIPAFRPADGDSSVYPQLYYFDYLGDSYGEVVRTISRDPLILVRQVVTADRLTALVRILLPLGLVLPFLAPDWAMLCLPIVAYMLLSDDPAVYEFQRWRTATIVPVLYAAIAVGLERLARHRARLAVVFLLIAALLGYALYSSFPLGGEWDPALYNVTDHHRMGIEAARRIPSDATVAAQVRYVPHLAHREHIYHYPWIVIGKENVDYVVLDRHSHPYPFSEAELNREIDDKLANPDLVVDLEGDGIYLFRRVGDPLPSIPVARTVDGTMHLARVEVASTDNRGWFRPVQGHSVEVRPGQQVRVSLYWEALGTPQAERTVSVRLADGSGRLIAQRDQWPAQGTRAGGRPDGSCATCTICRCRQTPRLATAGWMCSCTIVSP